MCIHTLMNNFESSSFNIFNQATQAWLNTAWWVWHFPFPANLDKFATIPHPIWNKNNKSVWQGVTTKTRIYSPLGDGTHLEHLPQLHFPAGPASLFLFKLKRLLSFEIGVPSEFARLDWSSLWEAQGRALVRASIASFMVSDSIKTRSCWIWRHNCWLVGEQLLTATYFFGYSNHCTIHIVRVGISTSTIKSGIIGNNIGLDFT